MISIDGFIHNNFDYIEYGNPPSDYRVNCPFCDDNKKHCYISMHKHLVHCFKCGYKSNWVSFVIKSMGNITYIEAMTMLYIKPSMLDYENVISKPVINNKASTAELPSDFKPLYSMGAHNIYRSYMLNRGIPVDLWKRYNLGMAEITHPYRIIIPIEKGYYQGRAIFKYIQPKYINPKVEAKNVLFNSRALKLYDEIIVCEGAFSAMMAGDNAIALIGKEPTDEKIDRLLATDVSTFILAIESGAFKSMRKLADALHCNNRKVIIWKYLTGDPADSTDYIEMEYNFKSKVYMTMD